MSRMMKIALVAIFLAACNGGDKLKVSEVLTLQSNDSRPFGGEIFYRLLEQQYPYELSSYNRSFSSWYKEEYATDDDDAYRTAYFIVSPAIRAFQDDVDAMKKFVEKGNTLILASDYFSVELQKEFEFEHTDINEMSPLRLPFEEHSDGTVYVQKKINDSLNHEAYSYFYTGMNNKLSIAAGIDYEVAGTNENQQPDWVVYPWGDGHIILLTNVRALTNYFLLTENNMGYAQEVIAWLPVDVDWLVWDKFYAANPRRSPPDKSIFAAFLQNEALRWAFWLTIASALLWLLLSLRRKQRIVVPVQPNTNDSVAFTETIANLYYNRHDNKNIAQKMMLHFNDTLRQRYYLPGALHDENFAAIVAAKTGTDITLAESLHKQIRYIQEAYSISDGELMQLHFTLEKVLQQKK